MFIIQFICIITSIIGILTRSLNSESESLLSCSKFHFEEKVLEKVVRLEHKMEVYAEKVKLWEESFSSSLDKVTKAMKQTETFVESMRGAHLLDQTRFNDSFDDVKKQTEIFVDSMRDAHLKDQTRFNDSFLGAVDRFKLQSENETEFYERQMNLLLDSFSSKVQKLSETERKRDSSMKLSLQQEQNRFNESFDKIVENFQIGFNKSLKKIASKQQSVALTACLNYAYTVSAGKVAYFRNIKTNIGIPNLSDYKSTGIFVCTVAGLYHVSAVMRSNTSGSSYPIDKNNVNLITTYYGTVNGYAVTRTSVVVTMLEVGDEISLKAGGSQRIHGESCFTISKLN